MGNACNRIDSIVASSRQRQGFTHFISLPVNHPDIQRSFERFQKSLLETCGTDCRGLDETVFQTPTLLHLTIGTLALMDDVERSKASELLHKVLNEDETINCIKELTVNIKGLEIMNDDPSEVDIIYGQVLDSSVLQTAADKIVAIFSDTGLMTRQFNRVKLHVTLLNTLFRKGVDDDDDNQVKGPRETLDSRPIFEQFADYEFGHVTLKEIHLSQRRAGRRTKENYYHPSAIVQFSKDQPHT